MTGENEVIDQLDVEELRGARELPRVRHVQIGRFRRQRSAHTMEEVMDDRIHDASEGLSRAAAEALEATERVLIEAYGHRMTILHW